jgi:hypothetical protein
MRRRCFQDVLFYFVWYGGIGLVDGMDGDGIGSGL